MRETLWRNRKDEREGDTMERQEALWYLEKKELCILCLVAKRHPPKMQSLSEAHLFMVCVGEMEEEILTAVGK